MLKSVFGNNNKYIIDEEHFGISDYLSFKVCLLDEDKEQGKRSLEFTKDNDFNIIGYKMNSTESKKLRIIINTANLFYTPLSHFLAEQDEEIIEDEFSLLSYGKKVTIKKASNGVEVIIEYKEKEISREYVIGIKNILYDGRSRLDNNTKNRLHDMFDELTLVFAPFKDGDQVSEIEEKTSDDFSKVLFTTTK